MKSFLAHKQFNQTKEKRALEANGNKLKFSVGFFLIAGFIGWG